MPTALPQRSRSAPRRPYAATPAAGFAPVTPSATRRCFRWFRRSHAGRRRPPPGPDRPARRRAAAAPDQRPDRRRAGPPASPGHAADRAADRNASIAGRADRSRRSIAGQSLNPQPIQAGPSAYGVQPTTFPFYSAPPFSYQPQPQAFMPPPMPMQQYVAFVTLDGDGQPGRSCRRRCRMSCPPPMQYPPMPQPA